MLRPGSAQVSQTHRVHIVQQGLNLGTLEEYREILRYYGREDVIDADNMLEHLERPYGFSLQYRHHNTLKDLWECVYRFLHRNDPEFGAAVQLVVCL